MAPEAELQLERHDASGLLTITKSMQVGGDPAAAADARPVRATIVLAGQSLRYRIALSVHPSISHPIYPLHDVQIAAGDGRLAHDWRIAWHAPTETRVLTADLPVPRRAHGQFCVQVKAWAPQARGAATRICTAVARQ